MLEYRFLIFLASLLILLTLERLFPMNSQQGTRTYRWRGNLGMSALAALLIKLLFPLTLYGWAKWCENQGFGLFHFLSWGGLEELFGFLLLDFFIWLQHLLSHVIPWFWRFHRVHHSDIILDTTTALRFHPLEITISYLFKAILVFFFGISSTTIIVFEIVLNSMAMFNHSNLYIPLSWEKYLNKIIITPRVHLVHHGDDKSFMLRNFGFNLVFWDKIFGFYREQMPSQYRLGLKSFRERDENRLIRLLLQPFKE